mmetsp:Transcript_10603/g.23361  ORF Transcript_10603/g.23361 Transcript_10603/m.23361 type:complete len:310 (-) Transcript_10603:139-1068(-)
MVQVSLPKGKKRGLLGKAVLLFLATTSILSAAVMIANLNFWTGMKIRGALVASSPVLKDAILPAGNATNFVLVQTSYADTGSTLLTNILMGLFETDPLGASYALLQFRKKYKKDPVGSWFVHSNARYLLASENILARFRVIKTHSTDLDGVRSLLRPVYGDRIFFVRSDRCHTVDPQCAEQDMLCIRFEDLQYNTTLERQNRVIKVAATVGERFAKLREIGFVPDVEMATMRVARMDEVISRMAYPMDNSRKSFGMSVDQQYGIHVNHRGQSKTWRMDPRIRMDFCGKRFSSETYKIEKPKEEMKTLHR